MLRVALLQALCTAVTEQNLLKTVTQIFAEAEAARLADANGHDKHFSLNYSQGISGEACPSTSQSHFLKAGRKGLSSHAHRIAILLFERVSEYTCSWHYSFYGVNLYLYKVCLCLPSS